METEVKSHSFSGSNAMLPAMTMLMNAIRSLDIYGNQDNYELLDASNNVVKSGRITHVSAVQSGDKVYLEIHIDDTSTESYTFAKVRIYGYGISIPSYDASGAFVAWITQKILMIEHTFANSYTKASNQAVHITLYHGIQGLI